MSDILCKQCGHPINDHILGNGCNRHTNNVICDCFLNPQDIAAAELSALHTRMQAAESELNFYHGFTLGDGDHDKVMLAKNAQVFLECFRLLGLDVSGTDIHEIPDAIERLKGGQA